MLLLLYHLLDGLLELVYLFHDQLLLHVELVDLGVQVLDLQGILASFGCQQVVFLQLANELLNLLSLLLLLQTYGMENLRQDGVLYLHENLRGDIDDLVFQLMDLTMTSILQLLNSFLVSLDLLFDHFEALGHFAVLSLDPPLECFLYDLYYGAMGVTTQNVLWRCVVLSTR